MVSVGNLPNRELQRIRRLLAETVDPDLRKRCQIILLSYEGLSPAAIAAQLYYNRTTITRLLHRYAAEGLAVLFPRPRPGRPRRITPEYERLLQEVASRSPAELGVECTSWTTRRLAEYLEECTGIRITSRHVGTYLKAAERCQRE